MFLLKLIGIIFLPLLNHGLYHFDFWSDLWNTITYFKNCHPIYGTCSILIIISSYFTTALFLKLRMKESLYSALLHPFNFSKLVINQIKRNGYAICTGELLPETPLKETIYIHHISFVQATSESILQLCLSCLILREFGLSNSNFDRFIQISGLIASLLSLCLAFAKVHKALFKNCAYCIHCT